MKWIEIPLQKNDFMLDLPIFLSSTFTDTTHDSSDHHDVPKNDDGD
ncbi:MAG: hypothetical protein PHW04_01805 [Candidatus Wallbacteria bacterium]|nr:hypothetical protein [Candidatus Wallbacteria bacterium]